MRRSSEGSARRAGGRRKLGRYAGRCMTGAWRQSTGARCAIGDVVAAASPQVHGVHVVATAGWRVAS